LNSAGHRGPTSKKTKWIRLVAYETGLSSPVVALTEILYEDDVSVESINHDGTIGSVADDLLHYWTGLAIAAQNLHSIPLKRDGIWLVRDGDQQHVVLEVDLRTSKKEIVAGRRGRQEHH
jgi:hypothetical protein